LPVVLAVYWRLPSQNARKHWLVLSSYAFYAAWSVKFAVLMLGTTGVDYFTARYIEDSPTARRRKAWLSVSLTANLGVLAIFKYFDFAATTINQLAPRPMLTLLHVALPMGISFYTFESMSYTIDVYNGKTPALRRFIDYAHFVTMFPRLVAGPIVRYVDLSHQLRSFASRLTPEIVMEAAHFFTIGMFKKVMIADVLAGTLVTPLFGDVAGLHAASAWTAALAYTAQLYFDFSGYSDMAVGLALLLGFRLPRNFNLPYRAENISEFWRRWHISLSTWLRDYLYIPLGGNRGAPGRTSFNLFVTMVLGGLWHGANWTFLAWGALHGVALVLYNTRLKGRLPLPRQVSVAVTFLVVIAGWVLFRSDNVGQAASVYSAMLGLRGLGLTWLRGQAVSLLVLSVALGLSLTVDTYDLRPPTRMRTAALEAMLLALCITRLGQPSPFLYFQF
jgi:alginate O-acetyltransferase complex protein AlgI